MTLRVYADKVEASRAAAAAGARRIREALSVNGHIAFNDPPADFDTEEPYLVVTLDEACRRQQLGEGWFPTLADVPQRAISMSVRQILKSKVIINTVPDARKATAVRDALEGPFSPCCPASALRLHRACETFLDRASASLLTPLAAEMSRV